MKTILIPIDFSAHSRYTAHFGLELARQMQAGLLLLHVVQPTPPIPTLSIPLTEPDAWDRTLYEQMGKTMQQFQETLHDYQHEHGLADIQVRTSISVGQPADTILDEARSEHAEFIVIGTLGATNMLDKLIGSVASAVAQHADRPVWILPGAVTLDSLRHFVYFADLAGNELACIKQVMNLGEQLRASTEVVHFSPTDENEFLAAEAIIEVFEQAVDPNRVVFRHLMLETVAEGIEDYVQNHRPDVVVLAHRHRGFLDKLLHPGTIRELSLTTKKPLLIVPKAN